MLTARATIADSGTSSRTVGHRRRLDIEGLRAVAVVAVVLDHLFHWPKGGFIGVDIFFVISGFLITGILLREAQRTGHISFKNFYIRRIKRILPAAALVLSVTVTAAYLIYYAGRANSIAIDAFWSILFSANWRFAILGTDYMNSGTSVSPLQHYWSLGVEEQFYIVWPWVILAGLFVARKIKLNMRGTTIVVSTFILVPLVVSFIYSLWETREFHTVAYFSTFSRGWELAAGALLAVITANFRGFNLNVRVSLLWIGLFFLASSFLLIGPETVFPGPYALLPVLGACLIILAGTGEHVDNYDRAAWLLSNPVSRYVGKISYSLYLWHFPVIIYLAAFLAAGTIGYYLTAISLMLAFSIASFKLVEDPIRMGTFGRRQVGNHAMKRDSIRWSRSGTVAMASFGVMILLTPIAVLAVFGTQTQMAGETNAIAGTPGPAAGTNVESRQLMLKTALAATEWPSLTPNPAEMGPDGALAKPAEWINDGCLGGDLSPLAHDKDVIQNAKHCVYGNDNAPKSMIIFGDSTTMSFVPGLRKALDGHDWKVYIFTVAGCSPTLVEPAGNDGSAEECIRFKSWVMSEVQRIHPTQVVSSFLRNDGQLVGHPQGAEADRRWQRQVTAMGKFITENGSEFILLGAPNPAGSDPSQCISRVSKPADCVTNLSGNFASNEIAMEHAVSDVGPRAKYVSTKDWFCVDAACPAFIGTTSMFADINHISALASEELAPLLANSLGLVDGALP